MLNQINLCGRVTTDIEIKTTPSGKSVAQFNLAVERDFSNNDGERETDFIPVVVWGGTAEFASKYFSKGKMMIVGGRLQTRKYQTQNGENRYVTEVIANNVYFAGDRERAAETENNEEELAGYTELDKNGEPLPF